MLIPHPRENPLLTLWGISLRSFLCSIHIGICACDICLFLMNIHATSWFCKWRKIQCRIWSQYCFMGRACALESHRLEFKILILQLNSYQPWPSYLVLTWASFPSSCKLFRCTKSDEYMQMLLAQLAGCKVLLSFPVTLCQVQTTQ